MLTAIIIGNMDNIKETTIITLYSFFIILKLPPFIQIKHDDYVMMI
jgi:hypothetical protein